VDNKKVERQVDKQQKRARQEVKTRTSRLPQSRAELMDLHRETRARRNAAAHGSTEHVAAIELIGRIEVEIARIERAMDPPLG
jgi:hypothetical protein